MGIDVGNTCICKHAHRFIFSVFGYFVMDVLFVGDMGYDDDDANYINIHGQQRQTAYV